MPWVLVRGFFGAKAVNSCHFNISMWMSALKYSQILNNNTQLYIHSTSLAIWPLTVLKRTCFGELLIFRFTTYIGRAFLIVSPWRYFCRYYGKLTRLWLANANFQDTNRKSMHYNHAHSLWITSAEHLQFLKISTHHSTSGQDKQVYDCSDPLDPDP